MHRILNIGLIVLCLAGVAIAGTGKIGAERSRIMVARLSMASEADTARMQQWIDTEKAEIISMAFSGDVVVVVYRR